MYTINYVVKEGVDYKIKGSSFSDNDSEYKGVIRAARKARKKYKGSGNTTFYTTEDLLYGLGPGTLWLSGVQQHHKG